jgi:hypothetical protein
MHVIRHNDPRPKLVELLGAAFEVVDECVCSGRLLQMPDMDLRVKVALGFPDLSECNRSLQLRTQLAVSSAEILFSVIGLGLPLFE